MVRHRNSIRNRRTFHVGQKDSLVATMCKRMDQRTATLTLCRAAKQIYKSPPSHNSNVHGCTAISPFQPMHLGIPTCAKWRFHLPGMVHGGTVLATKCSDCCAAQATYAENIEKANLELCEGRW